MGNLIAMLIGIIVVLFLLIILFFIFAFIAMGLIILISKLLGKENFATRFWDKDL